MQGYLLKLNYLNNIQRDSVYYGRRNLNEEEVIAAYGIWKVACQSAHIYTHLPLNCNSLLPLIPELHLLEKFRLISDIFCLPEGNLLADVIQFMVDQKYQFHPSIVCDDVRKAIERA